MSTLIVSLFESVCLLKNRVEVVESGCLGQAKSSVVRFLSDLPAAVCCFSMFVHTTSP